MSQFVEQVKQIQHFSQVLLQIDFLLRKTIIKIINRKNMILGILKIAFFCDIATSKLVNNFIKKNTLNNVLLDTHSLLLFMLNENMSISWNKNALCKNEGTWREISLFPDLQSICFLGRAAGVSGDARSACVPVPWTRISCHFCFIPHNRQCVDNTRCFFSKGFFKDTSRWPE